MKIAVLTSQFPAISETFVLNHITGLLDLGHEVDVIAKYASKEAVIHEDVLKYKILEKTRYLEDGNDVGGESISTKVGRFIKLMVFHPQIFILCLARSCGFKKEFSMNIFLLAQKFLSFPKYDIIHCHYGFNANFICVLKDLGVLKSKIVVTFHGADLRYGLNKGGNVYHRLNYFASRIIAISQYSSAQLDLLGIEKEKISYIPLGIQIEELQSVKRRVYDETQIHLITTARLVEEKDFFTAIEAIFILKERRPFLSLHYWIIGDGPLKAKILERITELNLKKNVHLLGPLDQRLVFQQLAKADIYLLTSQKEVLPIALIEAQGVGLPAIVTHIGAVNEIVLDKESGFVVPIGDVQAIVERIEYLIDYPELADEMGRFAKKMVERRFSAKDINYKLLKLYKDVLEEEDPKVNFVSRIGKKVLNEVRNAYQLFEVQRDTIKLHRKFSQLDGLEKILDKNYKTLLPFYDDYVSQYSEDDMAISLKLASFLLTFCEIMKPQFILDLGSGFSSFVLRYYKAQVRDEVEVYSVDDSSQWLAVTRSFVAKHELSVCNLVEWDVFKERTDLKFDFIFHNLGSIDIRKQALPIIIRMLNKNGHLLLDDMHKIDYLPQAKQIVKDANFQLYSLEKYTKDKFKRFSSLATPN